MPSQYLYISTAPHLTSDEMENILATAERNNAERGVTGFLLYNGRNFLQLLEGEESDLVALMTRIAHDTRHSGVSLIGRKEVEERSCPTWAMRRVKIAASPDDRRAELAEALPEGLDEDTLRLIMNFAVLN